MSEAVELPEELFALKRFHGHLGPYVTIGLRMGNIARRELGDYRGMLATVFCSLVPPMRCLVDGIQFSSGCTFGKANIKVKPGTNPNVIFTKGNKRLTVTLKQGLRKQIDLEMSRVHEEEQSVRYYEMKEHELFVLSRA